MAVSIENMLYGGAGATATGAALPFALPGELVDLTPANELRILRPSQDRVAARCVHFGTCGGCHYQHASYPAQLAIKSDILRETLLDAGITDLPEIATHAAEPWQYRNRIRLRVGEIDGELRVGYNRRDGAGGDPFLPIVMCPIAAPLLWRAAGTLMVRAKAEPQIAVWMKAAVEVELFATPDESKLQMTLFTRRAVNASFAAFCTQFQQSLPELSGAGVALLPAKASPRGRRFERAKPDAQWGAAGLMYPVDEESLWVSRGSFFQVNRFLVSKLARLATAGRGGSLAWDLYAGVGLFSRVLIKSFGHVIAVETAQTAATDLANALKSKRARHRAVAMTTLDFLQAAVVQRERPDLIVMDPPRAGIGPEVCALLARVRAPELVYVSCDPVTFARDLKQLVDSGYKLQQLHLVDMFPQTFHQEAVAVLTR